MILQALNDYYQRRCEEPNPSRWLPAFGLERKEIGFVFELSREGALRNIIDIRERMGNRLVGPAMLLPKAVKKTSGIKSNLLWENAEYVLGVPDPKKLEAAQARGKEDGYRQRLIEMQRAFSERIEALPAQAVSDIGVQAVLKFSRTDPAQQLVDAGLLEVVSQGGAEITFRLIDEPEHLVSQRPGVAPFVIDAEDGSAASQSSSLPITCALCLVSGTRGPIERLHTAVKGVRGAQTSGANVVSFNLDAFNSFGRAQGDNAPVGRQAAFAYTTALNSLLARESRQRVQVGDATTVFWAQRADTFEDDLALLVGAAGDEPDAHTQKVRALYEAIHTGAFDGARGDNAFYVLGLAPNAARIAVRFWHQGRLRDLAQRIREWFDDLAIARAPHDPEHPTLFSLLTATAVMGKADNVSPHLAGDLMHSLFEGLPLPASALQAVVQRCRADQARHSDSGKPVPNVSHARAALLKAGINRLIRAQQLEGREITVDLDPANTDPAYRLGRLFAAYERIQSDAAGRDLNRSIRDAYFGSAMSNPASAFPRLVQLNQHHMRDLRRGAPGLHVVRDRLLGEIWGGLPSDFRFPASQPLAERARFALGYYHQRQAFFSRPDDAADTTTDTGSH